MKRVLVVGLGRFGGGVGAVRWFAGRGDEVRVTDKRGAGVLADSVAAVESPRVTLHLGDHDPRDYEWADTIVVNPAIPFDDPLIGAARAAGKEIVTEIGLTLRALRGPVVGATGTNGKSTTVSLLREMLAASGVPVELGGNIGRSLLNEAATMDPSTVTVLELSSFQLAWLEHDEFRPAVGIVTNVSGDHFDRHPDFAHYAASKRRLVEAVPADGVVILRADDPVCRDFTQAARGRVVWFGPPHAPPVDLAGLRLAGRHNRANAAAAAHAALAVGATPEGCRAGLRRFRPLAHRLQPLVEARGIAFVDDAVSTTPVATAAAVEAFERPVVLLCGGRDKGLDWEPLVVAARRARAVVCYGETGGALHAALPGSELCRGFDAAVARARELARPGDVVLLSPGFSSYDEFPGFDARGARFRELIANHP